MMDCESHNVEPCLPGDHDRFNAPNSQSTNSESCRPTSRSWIFVQKPIISNSGGPQKCLTYETECSVTTHPEGSIIQYVDCVVSNGPVDEPLEALGKSLLERAGLIGCATAFVMHDGPRRIRYYLANHVTKAITWAHGDSIPSTVPTADPQRAQNMLCEEYWMHMENFPAPVPASAEDLHQLKSVLASLAVDASTSDGSTSPFSPAQIQEFLATLNTFSDNIETFQTYTIARLWSMIWHARVVNNYGTPQACLDRFTPLSVNPPTFTGPYKAWASYFIGAGADAHLARCSRAWAGRIAYVTEWRNFKSKNETEWNQAMQLACVLVIASLLVRSQSAIRFISSIALAFGCASAATSYHLVNESRNLGEQAADASVHFQRWETAQYGVQALALRNAAPRALLIYGFIIFVLSIVFAEHGS